MTLPFSETAAIARTATQTVEAIMRKRTAGERRDAFFAAYDRADMMHRRALYGAVATLFARLDAIPPAGKAGGKQP